MSGKFVGVDWYQGAYTVFEKMEDKMIPVESFKEVYDCIRHVCKEYDYFDEIFIPETISEIATLEVGSGTYCYDNDNYN